MASAQKIIGNLLQNVFKIKKYSMFQMPTPNQEVIARTQQEINTKLANYYKHPILKKYFKSLPPKTLLDQSVVMYVGSRTRPQSIPLRNELIRLASQKAQEQQKKTIQKMQNRQRSHASINIEENTLKFYRPNQLDKHDKHNKHQKNNSKPYQSQQQSKLYQSQQQQKNTRADCQSFLGANSQKNLAKYYTHAFTKYQAMEGNKPENWQSCSESIIQLADEGHHLSCMVLGKDYYARIQEESLQRQIKSQLIIQAAQYFHQSVTENNFNGLYYLGEMLNEYPQLYQSTQQQIQQLFAFAAVYGNPLAYAQLSKIYQKKGQAKLYMKYLKCAAEGGCVEAQHDLGAQYQRGLNTKKDQVKAFAWFKHAGANGYLYSKYNQAVILWKGSQCGRIKKNVKAALLVFEQIQRSNKIDVSSQIEQILEDQQIKKLMEENKEQQQKN